MAQKTGGAASKLARISITRKGIARVLTVLNANTRCAIRKQLLKENTKYWPKDMRKKLTRAKRRALTPAQVRSLPPSPLLLRARSRA